jgi:hypothetical protein
VCVKLLILLSAVFVGSFVAHDYYRSRPVTVGAEVRYRAPGESFARRWTVVGLVPGGGATLRDSQGETVIAQVEYLGWR